MSSQGTLRLTAFIPEPHDWKQVVIVSTVMRSLTKLSSWYTIILLYVDTKLTRFFGSVARQQIRHYPTSRISITPDKTLLLLPGSSLSSVLGQFPLERKDDTTAGSDQGGRRGESRLVQGSVRLGPDERSIDGSQVAYERDIKA